MREAQICPIVLQSVSDYLPLTERWLFHQLEGVRPYCESNTVCERLVPGSPYDTASVHCFRKRRIRSLADRTMRWMGHPEWMRAKPKLAVELRANIVHSHFADLAWSDRGVARQASAAHVVSVYGYDVSALPSRSQKWRQRCAQLFHTVDLVLCEGPVMAGRVQSLGCMRSKIEVHHLGVPSGRIAYRQPHREAVQPFRVLMAGSFTEKKGLPIGLRAVALLGRKFPVAVTIIGDSNGSRGQNREKAEIMQTIANEGLGAAVKLLGYQPYERLLAEFYEHDVFLCPSMTARDGDSEGGAPVTLMEVAASGLPIVATRHADIPYVLDQGACGLLAPERDAATLAQCLEAVARSQRLAAELSRKARRRVEAEFDQAVQGRRLFTVYQRLLERLA